MSERESMLLRADIFKNGQQEEIILLDDMILDGRNRYKACIDLGITPKTKKFEGDKGAALEFVIARNIHRRQLSASQKSIVALNCLPHIREVVARERIEKIRAARKEIQAMLPGTTRKTASNLQSRDIAGMLVGVSGRSVKYAEDLSKEAPEMVARVMKGDIALSKALREAKVKVKKNKGRPADLIGATLKRLIVLVETSNDVPRDVLEKLTGAMDALGKARADARKEKDEAAKAAKEAKAARKASAAPKGKKGKE
jgi:SHS2 domain-containing protein